MGYRTNETRRAKGWYNFEDAPEWASLKAEFQAADQAIRSNPTREDLVPLDRDQEFVAWYGSVRDFYPRVGGCGLDPDQVRLTQIINPGGLVSRIQGPNGGGQGGVPAAAARAFRQMYMEQIAYLQQQMPPPQQQIQALQQLVDQLNQFLQSLN
jgi:hypothetical protein